MKIEGRSAVISGAGSGLGRACAFEFANKGVRLLLVDRDYSAAKETAASSAHYGCSKAIAIQADIANPESVSNAVERAEDELGDVHICVNAAGIGTAGKIISKGNALPLESFQSMVAVNLIGTFDVMRRCAQIMITNDPDDEGERGVIINVSSGAAWQGQSGQAAYSASKAGLIGLTLPRSA